MNAVNTDTTMGRDDEAAALAIVLKGAGGGAKTPTTNRAVAEQANDDEELPNDGESPDDQDDQSDETEETEEDADADEELVSGEYSDDDRLLVTVDGEQKEVTIRELKQRFSGEGAIEKRLQEATEARKTAQAERAAAAAEIETHRANMLQTIGQLDQFLFMPLVNKPDPGLRQHNMQAYLMQKEAFEEDQARIAQLRGAATQLFNNHAAQAEQLRVQHRKREAELLQEKAPELKNPETAKAFQADLRVVMDHYGITVDQMKEVDNHLLFLIARDAGRYLKLQKATNGGTVVPKTGEKPVKTVRTLQPGASVPAGSVLRAKSVKVKQAALAQARKTGSVDDITNMLIANATVRKKR